MTFKNISSRKRRGLSSIVGALLFVVLMVSTFAVLNVALTSQSDIASTGRDVAAKDLQKQQEDFDLNAVQQAAGVGEFLQINMTNQGQNTAEMFTVIMTNVTDPGQPTRTFEVPSTTSFVPVGEITHTNIVNTLDLKMDIPLVAPDETYDFKIISSLGTIKTATITCKASSSDCGVTVVGPTGPSSLTAQLFSDGPTGINSKVSTVIMFVTNNGQVDLTNVRPLFGNPTAGSLCADMWGVNGAAPIINDVNPCDLDSPVGVTLIPGQSVLFKWDGTILGDVDDEVLFCNQARGVDPTFVDIDTAVVCDDLIVIDPNDCGGAVCGGGEGATIILIDDLLIRPSLFMVIPSPFGENVGGPAPHDKGVWGVNIINPTEIDMDITKMTIVSYPPTANDNNEVFEENCEIIGIFPLETQVGPAPRDWTCPMANTVLWQEHNGAVTLPARSAIEFLASVPPGDIKGNNQIDALIVQANVFSSVGSFGKGEGYQSTARLNLGPIVNVYLTDLAESRANANVHGVQNTGLMEDQEATFLVTLADMDTQDSTFINKGAKFIINVPRDWVVDPDNGIVDYTGFENCTICSPDDRMQILGDGSTQLILETAHDLGHPDAVSPGGPYDKDALTVEFKATPPCNEIVGEKRPYVMYILADGLSTSVAETPLTYPIGPLNEIGLIVDPDLVTTCVSP